MRKSLTSFATLSAVVFLVGALMFGGCSSNSPVAPDQPADLSRIVVKNSEPTIATVTDASYIKASTGGIVFIDRESYSHKFTVQAEAMTKDEIISSISSKQEINGKEMLVFEFGPSGLVFSEASELSVEIAEINPRAESANLYYFDPDLGEWVLQDTAGVKDGQVVFDIYHFSKYAISD